MKLDLAHLLLAGCAVLFGLAACIMLLLRNQQKLALYNARINGVMLPYRPLHSGGLARAVSLRRRLQAVTMVSKLALLLRYDPTNRALYPLHPSVLLAMVIVPAALFAYFVVGFIGFAGWLVLPAMALWLARSFYGFFEDRLVATLFRQFPDTLAMIVRAVRIGLPIVEAIRVVARESAEPTKREFTALVAQTAIGVSLDDALREMAERNRLLEYRFFATALSLQSQTGGGLTETLESLADTIRKRVAARMRGHALAAEARMSSYILGGLPLVTGALLSIVNPEYMAVLFHDPGGRSLLLMAAVLLMSGGLIMRFLIRRAMT